MKYTHEKKKTSPVRKYVPAAAGLTATGIGIGLYGRGRSSSAATARTQRYVGKGMPQAAAATKSARVSKAMRYSGKGLALAGAAAVGAAMYNGLSKYKKVRNSHQ